MNFLKKIKDLSQEELLTLTKFCGGFAALILVVVVLSSGSGLPQTLSLALRNIALSQTGAALWSTEYASYSGSPESTVCHQPLSPSTSKCSEDTATSLDAPAVMSISSTTQTQGTVLIPYTGSTSGAQVIGSVPVVISAGKSAQIDWSCQVSQTYYPAVTDAYVNASNCCPTAQAQYPQYSSDSCTLLTSTYCSLSHYGTSTVSTYATQSAGSGFSTGGALSGSVTVKPTQTTTYGLTCSNPSTGYSATMSAPVYIASASPTPTLSVTPANQSVPSGATTTVGWGVNYSGTNYACWGNGTTCNVSIAASTQPFPYFSGIGGWPAPLTFTSGSNSYVVMPGYESTSPSQFLSIAAQWLPSKSCYGSGTTCGAYTIASSSNYSGTQPNSMALPTEAYTPVGSSNIYFSLGESDTYGTGKTYPTSYMLAQWLPANNCWGSGSTCGAVKQTIQRPSGGPMGHSPYSNDMPVSEHLATNSHDYVVMNSAGTSTIYIWIPSQSCYGDGTICGSTLQTINWASLQKPSIFGTSTEWAAFTIGSNDYLTQSFPDSSTGGSATYEWMPSQSCIGNGTTCGNPLSDFGLNPYIYTADAVNYSVSGDFFTIGGTLYDTYGQEWMSSQNCFGDGTTCGRTISSWSYALDNDTPAETLSLNGTLYAFNGSLFGGGNVFEWMSSQNCFGDGTTCGNAIASNLPDASNYMDYVGPQYFAVDGGVYLPSVGNPQNSSNNTNWGGMQWMGNCMGNGTTCNYILPNNSGESSDISVYGFTPSGAIIGANNSNGAEYQWMPGVSGCTASQSSDSPSFSPPYTLGYSVSSTTSSAALYANTNYVFGCNDPTNTPMPTVAASVSVTSSAPTCTIASITSPIVNGGTGIINYTTTGSPLSAILINNTTGSYATFVPSNPSGSTQTGVLTNTGTSSVTDQFSMLVESSAGAGNCTGFTTVTPGTPPTLSISANTPTMTYNDSFIISATNFVSSIFAGIATSGSAVMYTGNNYFNSNYQLSGVSNSGAVTMNSTPSTVSVSSTMSPPISNPATVTMTLQPSSSYVVDPNHSSATITMYNPSYIQCTTNTNKTAPNSCSYSCELDSSTSTAPATVSWCCPSGGGTVSNSGSGSSAVTSNGQTGVTQGSYSLACSSGGTVSPLVINKPLVPPSITSYAAGAKRVRSGGSTTLTWTTASMTSCGITGSDNSVPLASNTPVTDGQHTVTVSDITTDTAYTLTCTDGTTPQSQSVTISLVPNFTEI